MKSVLRFFVSAIVVVSFAGCYTELARVEQNDREFAYDSDTSYENGNTTINNHYYLDDDYRRSRLRVSFNYYYPTYSSWISSYYFSYFNDPYWGMYHRPGYYDSYYAYYPPYGWCGYPSPYYDPWNPYYPPVAYYPGYYPSPAYGNNPTTPNRTRTGGSTRDPLPGDRSRPIPSTLPVTEPPTTGISTEIQQRDRDEKTPIRSPAAGRTPERPWWDKLNADRPTRIADEPRSRENVPAYNPPVNDRPKTKVEDQPSERPKNNPSTYTPPKKDRPAERSKRDEPRYSPPVKKSEPKEAARPVERSRVTRHPSYNPPPQSAPQQSAPTRSSNGGSSTGGSERKRD